MKKFVVQRFISSFLTVAFLSLIIIYFGTSGQIYKDDIENYLTKTSLEYMRNYFDSGEKELCVQYRRLIGDGFYKVLMEIKPTKEYTSKNQLCFLYVKNINKE